LKQQFYLNALIAVGYSPAEKALYSTTFRPLRGPANLELNLAKLGQPNSLPRKPLESGKFGF